MNTESPYCCTMNGIDSIELKTVTSITGGDSGRDPQNNSI